MTWICRMKLNVLPVRLAICLVLVALAGLCTENSSAQTIESAKDSAEPQFPKSEFDDTLPNGRDPFTLRPAPRRNTAVNTNGTDRPAVASQNFVLRGISGPPARRLALINTTTLGVGETAEVVIPGGKIRVRCEAIGEDWAVISFGTPPQRIELQLARRPLK